MSKLNKLVFLTSEEGEEQNVTFLEAKNARVQLATYASTLNIKVMVQR